MPLLCESNVLRVRLGVCGRKILDTISDYIERTVKFVYTGKMV